ncbi:FAD-containing oxidoreductase [Roseomonas marmotae]|uniref:FAD-containing oxidoreductase n=1 Tax=Roseomonas marmotae TaxID=2768161 RepID=A0ABS3KA29_9PROT|nr:FAD-containing oxidoreductase [Roseomonas marmotae]MBO1073805.1 FAD-containing oxidoreductase [Roseomonas marmotae]QTI78565.1 FAD-containing oxidoreductase [Roseomonas marmotae]
MKEFDAIIIGAGQAGPSLAGRLTAAGMNVALVERKFLGGTCVNTGCMPTKALVASARAAHVARNAARWGVSAGPVAIDMPAVQARAETVTLNARGNLETWLGGMERLTLLRGHACFEAPQVIRVGEERLTAPRLFLNVGARPTMPEMPGLDRITPLDSSGILRLEVVPEHLVVIGGSYIGLEYAQMHRRFGAEVTVIERGTALVPREDPDISAMIREILEADGITIHTGAEDVSFTPRGSGALVRVGGAEIAASHVLVATGRRPNTDDLGLEAAGVALDARGFVVVDDGLASSVPGIWALGDCNGRGAFTHTAYNDFEIVAANLLDGEARRVSDRIPAYALYIDPPLGRVGMTEAQARATGRPLLVSSRPMARVGRAVERGETQGVMKVVADAETLHILGAAILGVEGDEAIHGILDAMHAGTPYPVLRWAVPIHPTVSELIPTVLGDLRPAPHP